VIAGVHRIRAALLLATCLAAGGCIDSGNRGWDLGPEPDPAGGVPMEQAWRGVHEGRIGFRCRGGEVLLFVETWHPLGVPPGQRVPMELGYRFDVAKGSLATVPGVATARGIEVPAPRVGEGAANPLLQGLGKGADELLITLRGKGHGINILFDVEDAAHAHDHVQGTCRAPAGG
jgi:hypothetical protein